MRRRESALVNKLLGFFAVREPRAGRGTEYLVVGEFIYKLSLKASNRDSQPDFELDRNNLLRWLPEMK